MASCFHCHMTAFFCETRERKSVILYNLKVLTIVCNVQSHWVYGLCPSSRILNNQKAVFRKLDLFPSSGEGKETPTVLGPLGKNLKHWMT
jgi:hypothetical protein